MEFDKETQAMIAKATKMWSKWQKMTSWSYDGLTRAAESALKYSGDGSSGSVQDCTSLYC